MAHCLNGGTAKLRPETRATSFRACFTGLIGTLLAAERVYGLNMIACINLPDL
jgi:hypothetical protein